MRKLLLCCFTAGCWTVAGHAQTLFTYGTHDVSKDEFLRVYKKNSINKKPDMSDTALRSYLDLYALFRMKVAEADKEKLDTVKSINAELDNYRKQLAKNYLTDDQVITRLVKEAYERKKEDVHVEHIVVSCPPGADTVAAYRKIDSIYHVLQNNQADFESLAKSCSDDKGSREKGGDVGYFSGLQTVYGFENAAYNTPVGKISAPFRTQFGYHIVKVLDKRADRGMVKVAQILIASPKSKGEAGMAEAKKRADSVETMLRQGVPFYELVQKYSNDQFSIKDSGTLQPFGAGKMVPEFESAAFGLKQPGDVSEPVRTDYGYHIIKLIAKYPLPPYDSVYTQLKHKIEGDSRAEYAKEQFFEKIKEKNGFKDYPEHLKEVDAKLMDLPDTGKNAKLVKSDDYKYMTKPVFTLAGKNYSQYDFVKYVETLTHGKISGPKGAVIQDAYKNYVKSVLNDFEEHQLAEENPEFRNLMEEYRDGIMLFELMDRNVWSKAAHDTPGLQAFYDSHKSKYMWEPGFEGSVYKFKNKQALDTAKVMLKDPSVTDEALAKALNSQANPDRVTIQRGRYEFSRFKDATLAELKNNKQKQIDNGNGSYTLIIAKEVYPNPGQKTLEEARGYVVAEYQDYLEKQWNEKMRAQYPLVVNEKEFKSMVKKKGK